MKRQRKRDLKRLEQAVDEPRNELFDVLREMHDKEEIDTHTYVNATTALFNMKEVFVVLKEAQ